MSLLLIGGLKDGLPPPFGHGQTDPRTRRQLGFLVKTMTALAAI